VIEGVWRNGVGETLDFNKAAPMKAGAYVFRPAGGVHRDQAADEETIAQIVGALAVTQIIAVIGRRGRRLAQDCASKTPIYLIRSGSNDFVDGALQAHSPGAAS
jgi:hypothetical protein